MPTTTMSVAAIMMRPRDKPKWKLRASADGFTGILRLSRVGHRGAQVSEVIASDRIVRFQSQRSFVFRDGFVWLTGLREYKCEIAVRFGEVGLKPNGRTIMVDRFGAMSGLKKRARQIVVR